MSARNPIATVTLVIWALATCGLPCRVGAADGVHTWNQRIGESDALLRSAEYAAAYEITTPLCEEVGSSLVYGPDSALGTVLALQALAEAGTGRTEDALWNWHLAESLKPGLETMDLSPYGAAGALLAANCLPSGIEREDCRAAEAEDEPTGAEAAGGDDHEVTPPVKIAAPAPRYSRAAREAGIEGRVVLRTVIDREGFVRRAAVAASDYPCLAYMASRALRRWRFEPARIDGEPVEVHYNLTLNFSLGK